MSLSVQAQAPTTTAQANRAFYCEYSSENAEQLLASDRVLAVFGFSGFAEQGGLTDPRYIDTGLVQLAGEPVHEVWHSKLPVTTGREKDINWACNDEVLLLSLALEDCGQVSLHDATQQAYLRLLSVLEQKGFPHIIRVWNYLADINLGAGDAERYKQFCSGRHEGLVESGVGLSQFSAACALGHQGGPTVIYLLAAREPALPFENPKQISAYHYPREYGPKAPSFARAALKCWPDCQHLYVSGTASIVGHQSLCQGDVAGQLKVTFENISNLLEHVRTIADLPTQPSLGMLRVYVKNAEDLALIRREVYREFGEDVAALFVQADICRQELLVEIDALCVLPEAS